MTIVRKSKMAAKGDRKRTNSQSGSKSETARYVNQESMNK